MNHFPQVPGVGKPNTAYHTFAPIPKANILQPTQIRIVHMAAGQIIGTTPRLSVVRIRSFLQTATLTRMRGGYLV